jgi:hypothetical protein
MSAIRTLAAGTVLGLAAVSGLACLDPGPAPFHRVSPRHPMAAYMALAAAPFGNGLELFAVVASIFAVCIFVAGWRHARRSDPGREQQCSL